MLNFIEKIGTYLTGFLFLIFPLIILWYVLTKGMVTNLDIFATFICGFFYQAYFKLARETFMDAKKIII